MKNWNEKHDWIDLNPIKPTYEVYDSWEQFFKEDKNRVTRKEIISYCKECGMQRIQTLSGSNWKYKYYINSNKQLNSMDCNSVKQEKREYILIELGL